MTQLNLKNLTIHQAGKLLSEKQITSVELVESYLQRIEEIDGRIRAYVTVTPDLALAQAKRADASIASGKFGPLTGIPMQLKDNMCTKGVETTCSSSMLKGFIPPFNSHVAGVLSEAGAVLLGKGNLDEFAMGSSTENSAFFPTRNPWNTDMVPGGSSGGPAAAVAAGECTFSLGSDTGGSIRQPASFCGVVGMKPTYGLVSRYGLVAFASSLDQIGPLTADVEDSAILLNCIAGHDEKDSTSLDVPKRDYTSALKEDLTGLKIGIPKEYFIEGMDPDVQRLILDALDVLKHLGAEVSEISLPHTPYALAVYYIIAPSEASANLSRYDGVKYGLSAQDGENMWDAMEKTRQQGFGEEVKRRIFLGTYALSSGYYDAYYLKAQKVRTIIREEFEKSFQDFDVIAMPTSPSTAFPLGSKLQDPLQMYLNDVLTLPANIAGIPGISVPAGFSKGLPVGLQFMAGALQEEKIFRVAHAYEKASDWVSCVPDL